MKALEAAEASSQLALEATQLGYRVGVRVNVDVLNAQSQLYQTRRDLARARYDLLLATLRLRQASGRLIATDVLGSIGCSCAKPPTLGAPSFSLLCTARRTSRNDLAANTARRRICGTREDVVTSCVPARRASRRIGSASAKPTLAVVGGDPRGWLAAQIGPADPARGDGLFDTRARARARRRRAREARSWRTIRRPA